MKNLFEDALKAAIEKMQLAQDQLNPDSEVDIKIHSTIESAIEAVYQLVKKQAEGDGK